MEIFLSYSRQNAHLIHALVEDIEALGHDVWYDRELSGGQVWWDQILARIQNCDVFVFALSWHSLNSPPCRLEYLYADQLNKNILPVLMTDDVPINRLPKALSVVQFVDYRYQDKQAALLLSRSLANLAPSNPLPNPLPQPPSVPLSYLVRIQEQVESEAPLSAQEQELMLRELKDHFNNEAERHEIRRLLEHFRWRGDLETPIEREIDALLAGLSHSEALTFTDARPVSAVDIIVPFAFWIGIITLPLWFYTALSTPMAFPEGQPVTLSSSAMYIVLSVVCFPLMCAIFPGLPLALVVAFYYRGARIKLGFRDKAKFVEKLQASLPLRFRPISKTANEIVFKGRSLVPGMRTVDRIYVQFNEYSATIIGPTPVVNRIRKQMNEWD